MRDFPYICGCLSETYSFSISVVFKNLLHTFCRFLCVWIQFWRQFPSKALPDLDNNAGYREGCEVSLETQKSFSGITLILLTAKGSTCSLLEQLVAHPSQGCSQSVGVKNMSTAVMSCLNVCILLLEKCTEALANHSLSHFYPKNHKRLWCTFSAICYCTTPS